MTAADTTNEINKILTPFRSFFEFKVHEKSTEQLVILGSTDFSYYHQIELCFEKAKFEGPDSWRSSDNQVPLSVIEIGGRLVFTFAADHEWEDFSHVEIRADKLTFNTDTVLYYRPETLKEGQRVASWVK